MKESFQYVGSLVDAIAQLDGFFDQFLKDLMINSQGINLDVRNDFVAHFGERAVYLTDHLEPLNGDAEEQLFCIQLTNAEVVSNALDGVLNKDNTAEKKELDGQSYWTIDPNGEVNVADPKDPFFEDPFDDNPNGNANKPKKKRKRGLGSCVMVLRTDNNTGYLCFGVHEQQLIDVIKQRKNTATLVQQPNYVAVDKALKQLANNNLSFRSFVETDRAHRLNYELFRLGEFLEANTVLAKTLKQAFPTEKEKVLPNGRKIPAKNPNAQPLFNPNGQKLPPFKKVKQYFRPAGIAVESVDGGWLIHGAVLP